MNIDYTNQFSLTEFYHYTTNYTDEFLSSVMEEVKHTKDAGASDYYTTMTEVMKKYGFEEHLRPGLFGGIPEENYRHQTNGQVVSVNGHINGKYIDEHTRVDSLAVELKIKLNDKVNISVNADVVLSVTTGFGHPDETDVVIETTHLPQYIEPTFLAMRETMEKAIAKHGKVVIEGNN